jgi:hypothetical protein
VTRSTRTKKALGAGSKTGLPPAVDKIMKLDPLVRHVLLLDSKGQPLVFIGRPGKVPLESGDTQKMFFMRANILVRTEDVEDRYLGATRTLIAEREKVTLIWFPFTRDFTVLVSTEPGFSLRKVESLRRLVVRQYPGLLKLRKASN